MHGLGTIVNVAAIVVGGLAGLLGGRRIPERLQKTLMSAMGVSVLFVGVSGALSQMLRAEGGALTVQGTMMMILSLAVGAVLGELLRLIKIARDLLAARRVSRQDHIAADITLFDLNVHLSAVNQHIVSPSRSILRIFFSALLRGSMTSCPQPTQLSLKSMPVRSTFHCFEPHGCGFFIVRISPT